MASGEPSDTDASTVTGTGTTFFMALLTLNDVDEVLSGWYDDGNEFVAFETDFDGVDVDAEANFVAMERQLLS